MAADCTRSLQTARRLVPATPKAGTIDIRGATIRDEEPVYTGILIGNGNPPSAAFPIFTPGQQIPASSARRTASSERSGDGRDLALARGLG